MKGTLRSRLLLYLGLAVALSTALTVIVAAILVRHQADLQVQRTLDRQTETLLSVLPSGAVGVYSRAPARLGGVRAIAPARTRLILAAVPRGGDHDGTITVGGHRLLFSERGGVVLVRPAALGPGDQRPFLLSLILAGLGGAALATLLAFGLARRLVRPINELAAASRRLPEQRTAVEVAVRGPAELAQLALAFNSMSRALADARNAQRNFLLSVSHELKTPLMAIGGYAEGLQDGAVQPREAGDVIAAEAHRLDRLVQDLMDLARLDRHEFTVSREAVDLAEISERARARLAPVAAERGVRLRSHAPAGCMVYGDAGRLLQIASNLAENAVRVTPRGGEVTIAASGQSLSVSDTGPGLAAADLPHAFDRFYLHEKQRSGGSGLGLAIVRELAEVMGGSAAVESEPGMGARFSVTLMPASGTPPDGPR